MKVGDWVQVKAGYLTHWPEHLGNKGTVITMDGRGVEVRLTPFEAVWVAEEILEEAPEERAMRHNAGKPELSYALSFGEALRVMAEVSMHGAHKYDRGNYLKAAPLSQSVDCLLRHLLAWWEGEDKDPESGQAHLGHVVWNALRLCQESIVRPDLDDRIAYAKAPPAP